MVHLADMEIFARVVETKSFTAAGKELRLSISAVSKHITRLEDALSLKLLERSSHQSSLTESGRVYYEHCVRILAAVETAKADASGVSGKMGGTLRVHCTPSVGNDLVAPATVDFAKAHSSLKIELTIGNLPVDPTTRGLDIIVTSGDAAEKDSKAYDSFVTRKLGSVPYIICASPEYFSIYGRPNTPRELLGRPCLVHLYAKRNPNEWMFREGKGTFFVKVDERYKSTSVMAVLIAAVEGLGIAMLPEYTVRAALASGLLESIFADSTESERVIRVYYARSKYIPLKVRSFVECLRKQHQLSSCDKEHAD